MDPESSIEEAAQIIHTIRRLFIKNFDRRKTLLMDEYLRDMCGNPLISAQKVMLQCLSNLQYHVFENKVIVHINDGIMYPSTKYTLGALYRLITFGNSEISGYPLMSDIFEYLNKKYGGDTLG